MIEGVGDDLDMATCPVKAASKRWCFASIGARKTSLSQLRTVPQPSSGFGRSLGYQ